MKIVKLCITSQAAAVRFLAVEFNAKQKNNDIPTLTTQCIALLCNLPFGACMHAAFTAENYTCPLCKCSTF